MAPDAKPPVEDDEEDGTLFESLTFYLSPSLMKDVANVFRRALEKNSASIVSRDQLGQANYVITDSHTLERDELDDNASFKPHIVTPTWLWSALWNAKLPDPEFFSTDPRMIFSGVVACCSDIPTGDREAIAAGVQSLGGQYRYHLTRDVTHLFALSPQGAKYESAMHHYNIVGQPQVVTPHWFDDSFKLQRLQPVELYLFPDPLIFNGALSAPAAAAEGVRQSDKVAKQLDRVLGGDIKIPKARGDVERRDERQAVWSSVKHAAKGTVPSSQQDGVWVGQRILLSNDLDLAMGRRESVNAQIVAGDGVVVDADDDNADYDILITTYCEGAEYRSATRAKKLVGTLPWLFYVMSTGRLCSPNDHLLHAPCPSARVPEFRDVKMTVTVYAGDARDYLKKLLAMLGADPMPSLKRDETKIVVAACKVGEKTTRAEEWGIPIVNHLWVEECFKRWKYLHPSSEPRFTMYPRGVHYGEILGQRGIGNVRAPDEDPLPQEEASTSKHTSKSKPSKPAPPPTARSPTPPTAPHSLDNAANERLSPPPDSVAPQESLQSMDEVEANVDPDEPSGVESHDAAAESDDNAMDIDDNQIPSPSPGSSKPKSSAAPAPSPSRGSPSPSATPPREPSVISLDSTPKSKPKPKPVSNGRKVTRAISIELSEDSDDSDRPTADQLLHASTQAQKRSSPLSSPPRPQARATRARESDSDVEVRPVKKVRPNRKAVGTSDEEDSDDGVVEATKPAKPAVSALTNDASTPRPARATTKRTPEVVLTKKKARISDTTELANSDAENSSEVAIPSRNGSTRKLALQTHRSEPMPSSPSKPTASASQRTASLSAVNTGPSRTKVGPPTKASRAANRPRTSSTSTKPATTSSANSDAPPDAPLISTTPGRSKRMAATKAAVGLAANVEDMNRHQADLARSKGDPRKLSLKGLEASASEYTTESETKVSVSVEDISTDERESTAESSVAGPSRKATNATTAAKKQTPHKPKVLMTKTGYKPEDVFYKKFAKLVHITEDPDDCTIVVCSAINRTEKFVRAMPHHPKFVNTAWMTESAGEGQLKPPDEYLLNDPEGEERWHFDLNEALERARTAHHKLFAGYTFYITKKVQLDFEVLRRVAASAGATAHQATHLNERMFIGKDKTILISCPDDRKEWINLAKKGVKIYTAPLILNSVLTQKIDWKGEIESVEITLR